MKGVIPLPSTFYAVRGQQRKTDFFLTTLEYGDIATLVVLPEEFLGDELLEDDETMQRKLSWNRVRGEMKKYLLEFDDAFYSALTLIMVPRDLTRLEEGEDFIFEPAKDGVKHGELRIRSTCVLFPGDGQHRAASIKEALRTDPKLAGVEIPVVLIPFTNKGRVRQLFSDLNLNAKPVNRTIGLSFETRDPIALISKALIDRIPLFEDGGDGPRVNRRTNSLPASSRDVVTVNALYEGTALILKGFGLGDADLEPLYSADAKNQRLLDLTNQVGDVWEVIIDSFPEWQDVVRGALEPGEVRDMYVYPHGLGWQAIAHAASVIIADYPTDWAQHLRDALTAVDWSRTNLAWQGVAMVGSRVNNTGPGIRATAGYILEQGGISTPRAVPYLDALTKSRSAAAAPAAA
jgi:DGQHR domain-containing protein